MSPCWLLCFSFVEKERLADGLEFYLSRLDDYGSLALKMTLRDLDIGYLSVLLLVPEGVLWEEEELKSVRRRFMNLDSYCRI